MIFILFFVFFYMKGNVYLFKTYDGFGNEIYKIGFTKGNPYKRLSQLQTGNSEIIEYVTHFSSEYARKIETAMHNGHNHERTLNEWFLLEKPNDFLIECKKIEDNLKILDNKMI